MFPQKNLKGRWRLRNGDSLYFTVCRKGERSYLYCTFSPSSAKGYGKESPFFTHFRSLPGVGRADAPLRGGRIESRQKVEIPSVSLSFSELKYYMDCPYQFKLRFLYGFNPPADVALGFGKSIHNALSEIHRRALTGIIVSPAEIDTIVLNQFHTPFATQSITNNLRTAATALLKQYVKRQAKDLLKTIHSELPIEVHLDPGITVKGRIDLVRREDSNEVAIVDFKSNQRAQSEEVSAVQLNTYALGYRQLTGTDASKVGVINLDQERDELLPVNPQAVAETERIIRGAADALRNNDFKTLPSWCSACAACDFAGICRKERKK